MASVITQRDGKRLIQFAAPDGSRKTIRLGKLARRHADVVKHHVEELASAILARHPPRDDTIAWLDSIGPTLHKRLAGVGLVAPKGSSLLGGFIDDYLESRTDVKESTRVAYERTRRYLVGHFGEDKPIRDITSGDADAWRRALRAKGLADNTVRRSCGVAKQFFTAAMRRKLVSSNPFSDLVAAVRGNPERYYFVTREEAEKVLAACPDAEWRLLFALARFGGLRVPSEVLLLRWSDIHWDTERFLVHSPKTEHHQGKESRVVPIFPDLKPYLVEAFEAAEPGAEFCITRYRTSNVNLRTYLQKIIKRAGLQPWPKLWQNLRSTCQTELCDRLPAHVVSRWIGNSVLVATRHYLQVTEDHYRSALQNALQQPAAGRRNTSQVRSGTASKSAKRGQKRRHATPCDELGGGSMGATGLEPVTSSM